MHMEMYVANTQSHLTVLTLYYYYYYYLTAIGLTPGGNCVHLHTNSTQNTEDGTHIKITGEKITITRNKLGRAGRAPSLRVIPWHLPYN
jgi:hypothetical protein